ncbi:hypothetical protein TNCV_462391 [Trichonephila clavipes]|nr:hypothetical protein TNCV_462391 [Trichonephila clavipes]
MVANVSDETVLLVDEDSNRLRRKKKEAILKEMEKSVVHEEPTELVYEQVERDVQMLNNVIKMANAEQIKRIGQDVKTYFSIWVFHHLAHLYQVFNIFQQIRILFNSKNPDISKSKASQ